MGSRRWNSFYLNTHLFNYEENLLLQEALITKLNIKTSIHKHKKQFKLYIPASSILVFKKLVTPYIHESMLYKLNHRR